MSEAGRAVLCSGEEVEIFDGEDKKEILDICVWSREGVIKPINGNRFLPKEFLKCDSMIYNFKFRSTDVFVNGYPKSGTTWVQEIIWTLLNNANLDHPLTTENVYIRIPWFECDMFQHLGREWFYTNLQKVYGIQRQPNLLDMYEKIPDRRVFKSHLYASTINKNMINTSKVVYVVRNPMDSCYSFYFWHRFLMGTFGLTKTLEEYADIYQRGELLAGNAVEHIGSWWPYRNHKNVYLIFYEDLKTDPTGEIRKLAKFLEKEVTEKQIQNVLYQSSFKTMKKILGETEDDLRNYTATDSSKEQASFFRKGVVGDSKNLPKEVYDKLSSFFGESLKNFGLPYTFKPQ